MKLKLVGGHFDGNEYEVSESIQVGEAIQMPIYPEIKCFVGSVAELPEELDVFELETYIVTRITSNNGRGKATDWLELHIA